MTRTFASASLACAVLCLGCGAARIAFTAQHASFPVSMTEGFYDDDYDLVLSEDYDVVRPFTLTYRHTTISGLARTRFVDLSDTFTRLVRAYSGDAVVNLEVTTNASKFDAGCLSCLGWFLTYPTLGFLIPSQFEATVTGRVVKLHRQKSELLPQRSDGFAVLTVQGRRHWVATDSRGRP